MKLKRNFYILFIIIFVYLQNFFINTKGAENIYLYKGTFSRSISVLELEEFLKNGQAKNKLKRIIKLANQNEKELSKILEYEIEMPISLSSKLMYSSIGETIIKKITEIIYPNKYKKTQMSIMALRSAVIQGTLEKNGKLTVINFLKAYPNKNIAINLNALYKTLNKVESLSELIKFYSNSPLEKLKKSSSKT